MHKNNETGPEAHQTPGLVLERPDSLDKYKAELGDLNLTDEQAEQLLSTLYDIIRMFVEMGFSADLCGQLLDGFNQPSSAGHDDVDLSSAKEDRE